MKTFFSILASLFITSFVFSQTQSTVTIDITGNRNKQVTVDSRIYTVNNTTSTEEQSFVITDLAAGQHSLEVARNNQFGSRVATKTYFTVRDGYNLVITIGTDATVSTSETRIIGSGNNNAGRPITTAQFNRLYSQTQAKISSSSRTTFLENEFANTNRRLTSSQARQLIALVNSESSRLRLAKDVYPQVTDRQNFNTVSSLLYSTSNRNELSNYITSLNLGDDDYAASDMGVPMTNNRFRTIFNEASAETNSTNRYYYLNNFFNKDANFYTSSQAAQLIQLVPAEEQRFNLAKTAYRGVTDRNNYTAVFQLLSNYSNRTALTAYINNYDNTSNVRVAMSEFNYNRLYQSVYNESVSTRYTSINRAFSSDDYFTVAQAKRLIVLVNNESYRLALAKTAYKVLVDRSNYTQFYDFLPSSYNRNDLNNYVANFNNSQGTPTGGYAMSETDYNRIYQNVTSSWSSSTRVNAENQAFGTSANYFSTDQVRRLLLLITSETDRLSLAKSAYDNTVDQNNYTLLYDVFSNSVYKNDLARFIANNGGPTNTIGVAMSATEFNSMYSQVQLTFGLGAKMSSLTNIFNTETNYFTVQQAKQLIALVSAEDNRLTLAKLAYNNIVDPENFNSIYDLLSSQSSKNDLAAFVNNNGYIRQ